MLERTNITPWLEKQNALFWVVTGIASISAIGIIDYLTGYEIAFSLFYLLPVALLTWFTGKRPGIVASVASALIWLLADIKSGQTYAHPAIFAWNSLIRLSFFIIVAFLLSALRKAHQLEKELARIDSLTGAANTRFFSELVHMEIERSLRNRQPFTIVYLDLDNFKSVNDLFGHSMGDKALCAIVKQAKSQLRKVDVVARIGGDEFAFLLPETNQAAAQVVIQRVQTGLLEEMSKNNWPVTFSMGVLTCIKTTQTSDELIKRADELMYWAKKNGKNSVQYSVYAS
jgi:diguanylate cyclase (GGDEF)-like protein